MKLTIFFAAGIVISTAAMSMSPVLAKTATVASVTANAKLEDAENANALEFWPEIERDLNGVIEAALVDRRSDDGYEVSVELKEISLSGANVLIGEGEFNHMEGWVYFREPGNPVPVDQDLIVLDAETLSVGFDNGVVILPDVPAFYSALLLTFAAETVEALDELDPVGTGSQEENRSANE